MTGMKDARGMEDMHETYRIGGATGMESPFGGQRSMDISYLNNPVSNISNQDKEENKEKYDIFGNDPDRQKHPEEMYDYYESGHKQMSTDEDYKIYSPEDLEHVNRGPRVIFNSTDIKRQEVKKSNGPVEGNQLEQLKKFTTVVADTGDFNLIQQFKPEDATTNPSLILAACKKKEYDALIEEAITYAIKTTGTNDPSPDDDELIKNI